LEFVASGGAVGGDDSYTTVLARSFSRFRGKEMDVHENVPVEMARKARKGTVRERKPGYRLVAARTPTVPAPRPRSPPITPPLTVALEAELVIEVSCLNGLLLGSWNGSVLTCNAALLLLS
jgi:hypothetical protein